MSDLCTMKYEEWQKRKERFVVITGYAIERFNTLLPYFKEAHMNIYPNEL
ncbi:MAG: hypothetical protein LBR10_11030 [Prevotellaceae bacterium]|jgi:hypothetical protein|nr:hypothetical protein [Prevotellaceae bacterium]